MEAAPPCGPPDMRALFRSRISTARPSLVSAVLLACALGSAPPARSAQLEDPEFLIDTWETEQGLPEDSATSMVQTPDGYLWFGTFNGLVRFDGVKLTIFDRSNTPQLPSPGIVNLHLDRSGRLWVSTLLGMATVKDGVWTVYRESSGWIGNYVRFFAESASGQMYFTTFDGKVLRFHADRFEELPQPPARWQLGFVPYVDHTGALWVINPQFIGKLVEGKWQATISASSLVKNDPLRLIMAGPSRRGGVWIATRTGLRRFDDSGRVVFETSVDWGSPGFWSLHEDSTGAVWVCSHNFGVYRLTPDGRWRHFTTGQGISYHAARFVFEDREGNWWIGTSGGGLNRLKHRSFVSWGLAQGLPERVVVSVTTDQQDRIIMGTFGKGPVRLAGREISWVTAAKIPLVQSTLVDRQGRIWVGSLGGGLYVVEGATYRSFFTWPMHQGTGGGGTTGATAYSLFEDSHGRIWVGLDDNDPRTYEGATCFEGFQYKTYALEGSPLLNTVRTFAEDPKSGTLFAGTHARGLYRLDGDRFVAVPEAVSLIHEHITALHADADGTLWIGTEDGGIACLRNGVLTRISEKEGLPARAIGSILDDQLGNLWFGSNRGVLRVPRSELEALIDGRKSLLFSSVFNRSDGLASVECSLGFQPTATRDREGKLWFATYGGAVTVDPRRLQQNVQPPPVVIESLLVDGQPSNVRAALTTVSSSSAVSVTVPAGAKRLEVHYAGLSFTAPEKVRFRYMLEGFDKDWIDVGDRRVAYLQDLQPGKYRIRVKAANNDGVWNEAGASLALDVRPFIWQTLWFRFLALFGLIAAVGLTAVRMTHNRLQRRIERLEQRRALEQERARLASVLEATSDYVGFTDVRGNLLYLNPAGRRLVGLGEDDEIRGRTLADFHPAWATTRILEHGIPSAIREGIWQSETALLRPDGREIPLSQVIVVHNAAAGTVDFVSTIARDISEHKRAEQALREAEEKYRDIFENSALGIFQIRPDGRFLTVNPALARMLGYASPAAMLDEVGDIDTQVYVDIGRRRELRVLLEKQGVVHGFEAEFRRRDGSRVWVSKSVRVVRDESGNVLYYEGTSEDISDRQRARHADAMLRVALEKAAVEWELTFDAMESPVLILDADRRIARLNRPAQELAARASAHEVLGLGVQEVAAVQPWPMAGEMAEQVVRTQLARHCQVRDSLTGRTWDLSAGPSAGPGADGKRVIVVARDVTRMVELQDSLRRSETMSAMGMLVAGVAHEVRNPLFSISANLDAFDAKMGNRPEFTTFITLMRAEVERLAGLMRELLDYGKPAQTTLAPESVAPVVADAIERCESLAARGTVRILNQLPPKLPRVALDRNRLVQVFQNLLQNAIQHSPVGGAVSVKAELEKSGATSWLALVVTDSGPGFEAEDVSRIFMPFFSKRRGGTGLGLAVVQRIVEEHGGRIAAGNRPEGGAVMTVRLPCFETRGQDAQEAPSSATAP
jgi:PAS domain S-box-containing protein